MKCDICDEEFDTENQLVQHKAQMHAGENQMAENPENPENPEDDDLEEPDFKVASGE